MGLWQRDMDMNMKMIRMDICHEKEDDDENWNATVLMPDIKVSIVILPLVRSCSVIVVSPVQLAQD
jgi:hypothetical protein